jgi:hypothetical protein
VPRFSFQKTKKASLSYESRLSFCLEKEKLWNLDSSSSSRSSSSSKDSSKMQGHQAAAAEGDEVFVPHRDVGSLCRFPDEHVGVFYAIEIRVVDEEHSQQLQPLLARTHRFTT